MQTELNSGSAHQLHPEQLLQKQNDHTAVPMVGSSEAAFSETGSGYASRAAPKLLVLPNSPCEKM